MLHLIAENALSLPVVERIAAGDDVVLQAGAVWAAFCGHQDNPQLSLLLSRPCGVYVLQDVLAACGMDAHRLMAGVVVIDYAGLVRLTEQHPVIQTWY